MKVRVKNFGPIEMIDIEIRPLTVIIGKNNLGKSYLAQLYYALLETTRMAFRRDPRRHYYYLEERENPFFDRYDGGLLIRDEIAPLTKQISRKTTNSEILQIIIKRIEQRCTPEIRRALRLSLEKTFGVKVGKLVNINANKAMISWDVFEHFSLKAQITKRGTINVELTLLKSGKELVETFQTESLDLINKLKRGRTQKDAYFAQLLLMLESRLMKFKKSSDQQLNWKVSSRRQPVYYIPAGRGGLVESYETVVGGLVSLSPLAPVRGLSFPPLPGMAAQFYSVLLKLQGRKGPLSEVVTEDFKELLQGDVRLKKVKGQVKARLIYRFSSGMKSSSTDVIHAASMIKELAPIYLILQELIAPGCFLLVEEPESHLHPGAQIKLVNIFGALVTNGVNVFLTTHSDLFLRALGHWISENSLNDKTTPFTKENLTIIWLKNGEFGCVSEKLRISTYGTIQDIPTFDEIVRELYEEEIEIERKVKGRK